MNFFDPEPLGGHLYYSCRYILVLLWLAVAIWASLKSVRNSRPDSIMLLIGGLLLASIRLTRWNWTLSTRLHSTFINKEHDLVQYLVFGAVACVFALLLRRLIRSVVQPSQANTRSSSVCLFAMGSALCFVFWQSSSFEEWLPQRILLNQPGRYIAEYLLTFTCLLSAARMPARVKP